MEVGRDRKEEHSGPSDVPNVNVLQKSKSNQCLSSARMYTHQQHVCLYTHQQHVPRRGHTILCLSKTLLDPKSHMSPRSSPFQSHAEDKSGVRGVTYSVSHGVWRQKCEKYICYLGWLSGIQIWTGLPCANIQLVSFPCPCTAEHATLQHVEL